MVAFWKESGPGLWFAKDPAFDERFRDRFLQAHEAAAAGGLADWADTPYGSLALVLLLDQFPRNAFRGTPRMYASDAKAREIARLAVDAGFDRQADPEMRPFFYLPFMHSEQLADLNRCVELTHALGEETHHRYAVHHRGIIERFGRFPHRNAILGRASTREEDAFLAEGGFGG